MILIKQEYIKSPLNYVGGKYKLLPQILPLFPKNIDTCIDLFGGWTNADEKDLRDMLATSNVKWALSNNLKTNLTLKDWAENHDYKIHYLNITYKNCNHQKKDKTKDIEVLITNY